MIKKSPKELLKYLWNVNNPTDEDIEYFKKHINSYDKQYKRFRLNERHNSKV